MFLRKGGLKRMEHFYFSILTSRPIVLIEVHNLISSIFQYDSIVSLLQVEKLVKFVEKVKD